MLSKTMRLGLGALLAASAVAGCQCDDGVLKTVAAEIEATPNPVAFGAVAVGAVAEQLVEVSNLGTGPLNVESVTVVEGDDVISVTRLFTTSCEDNARTDNPMSIGAGGCARFAVRMLPSATGPVSGLIRIVSDAVNASEYDLPVTGDGVEAVIRACALSIEVDGHGDDAVETEVETCTDFTQDPQVIPTVEFADLPAGETSERIVRIYNLGEGSLALTSARVETDWPALFVEGDSFSGQVAAGTSIDLKVMFAPKSSGEVWGTLLLPSNDAEHPTVQLPVIATGLGASLCMNPETGVDFGPVTVGETRTQGITFENCGYLDYDITMLQFAEDDLLDPKYTVKWVTVDGADADAPEIPLAFSPGNQLFAEVTYSPTKVHGDEDPGDIAGFSIKTGYQSGRVPVRGKGANPGCAIGGPPTPVVRATEAGVDITNHLTTEPLKIVTLNAATSTVPGGGPRYAWRLVRKPQGSSLTVTGAAAKRSEVDLYLDIAGEYEVELVLQDQYACAASPETIVLTAKPSADLHIQLTWPERHGDVDIHLVRNGGDAFSSTDDCFYNNCKPGLFYSINWGGGNKNPTLDIDATWGRGPENINVVKPADGSYSVQVHYYCSKLNNGQGSDLGASTPRIRVYANGVVAMDEFLSINSGDMWTVGTIVVSGGAVVSVTPSPSGNVVPSMNCQYS